MSTATQQPKGDGGSDGGVVWGLGGTHATAAATLSSWKKYYGGTGAIASNNFSNLAVWLLGGQVVSFYYNHVLLWWVQWLVINLQIAHGIHGSQDLAQFADIWIAWGFQCNFMFKPVL